MTALKLEDIKNILILGCGTLGFKIALQFAISGYRTCLYDISEDNLLQAKKNQKKLLLELIKNRKIDEQQFDPIVNNLWYTTDAKKAAESADFINESVVEDLNIKKQVWKQFGNLCPSHTLFTTNSSFLLPSQFSEESGRPDRFCAFHFHDVFIAKVVDIMPQDKTAPWVADLLYDLGVKLNQIPVHIKKESNGYLFNFMLMSLLTSASSLFGRGIGSIKDIDRSFMGNFGIPIGPFGMMDQVGLDTALHIAKNNNTKASHLFADILQPLVDQGKLGVKSGEGFYCYPDPEFLDQSFLNP